MKKMRGLLLGIIVAICAIAPFTIAYAEENEFTVHFSAGAGIPSYLIPDDQTVESGSLANEPNYPRIESYGNVIFLGWFEDSKYETAFDFDTPITENTTIYGRFVSKKDLEKAIKEKLDAANISVTSTMTEAEALSKYKNDRIDTDDFEFTEINEDIEVNADIVLELDGYNIEDSYNAYYRFEYEYAGVDLDYYYNVTIKYANSDNHDAELDEAAKDLNNSQYKGTTENTIQGLVDYSKVPEADATTNVFTYEELRDLYNKSINKIKGVNKFDLDRIDEYFETDPEFYDNFFVGEDALTNNGLVYGYFSRYMYPVLMVTVDPDTENNHAAYVENVKARVKALLESKGYTNIQFELGNDWVDTEHNYWLRVFYGEPDDEGDYQGFSIAMMKDENTYLLAKNLTTDYSSMNLYHIYAQAYSEEKDDMDENYVASIESMKSTLEGEGYDFFDGYDIEASIPEGSTASLTFTVGTANNNRRFRVYHTLANGTVEKFDGIVKDGQFTIEVSETSPFAVGLGEVVKATNNNPQTFDPIILSVLMLALSAIGLIGGSIYLTKSRLN